jgi:dienelactone hydrolase
MTRILLLFASLTLGACATAPDRQATEAGAEALPKLTFSSNPARLGYPLAIRVTGLTPASEIQVVAERPQPYGWNRLYRSRATFRADDEGTVDLSVDAPVSGSWTVADPNGLFWSMRNTGDEIPAGWARNEVRIRVLDEADAVLARDVLHWRASLEELVETPLGEDFPGAFVLRKPGDEPRPAIIILGGSEGGDMTARMAAPLWAERGYLAVGYPYHSPSWPSGTPEFPELPEDFAKLPLDKLVDVRDAVRELEGVVENRIGLIGTSKGAEFVLAAASRIDGFSAVAAIVPSDVIWEGWGAGHTQGETPGFSWRGEPLPFVPYVDIARGLGRDAQVPLSVPHAEGRDAYPERVEAARIRVEDIDEPVFLLGGGRDRTWPSGEMAIRIAADRTAAGLETETLVFATGGHGLGGPPQLPTRTASVPARTAGWRALNAFFERTLKDIDPD